MTTATHPFPDERIETVASERGVPVEELSDLLDRIEGAITRDSSDRSRSGGGYEYSSEHNYGWRDDDAYYLYGDGVWERFDRTLSPDADLLDAARAVHREAMLDAAGARGERETVEGMFADGNEPLVVTNTAEEPPRFGQDL